jgi:hypothetical protein
VSAEEMRDLLGTGVSDPAEAVLRCIVLARSVSAAFAAKSWACPGEAALDSPTPLPSRTTRASPARNFNRKRFSHEAGTACGLG